ncbi:MAG: hypothetical protein LJE84_04205 [Gammaproteobacteria bacterium]|jgi:hypothetical protein|nr:hypothetical protein [Gammaproteobacteria bacterium]
MHRFVLPAILATALGVCAVISGAQAGDESATTRLEKIENRPLCESSAVTGTRIRTKRCWRNKAAKDAAREEAQRDLALEQRSRMTGPND